MSQPKWISQNEKRIVFNQAVFNILKTNPVIEQAFRTKMQNVTTVTEFDFVVRQFLYEVQQKIDQIANEAINQQNALSQNNMDNTVSFESVMMQNPDAITSQQAEIADTISNSYTAYSDDDSDLDQNTFASVADAYAANNDAGKAEIFTKLIDREAVANDFHTSEELTKEKDMTLKPMPPILNEKE